MKTLIPTLFLLLPAPALAARPAPLPAAQESVDALLARGRALLSEGKAGEALTVFEQAGARAKGTIATRTWVLRAWIAQGRVNDALDQVDALAKGAAKDPRIDYLYGMAFWQKARGYMRDGAIGSEIQMNLEDAVASLQRATTADPALFADAFAPLAESAWFTQKLDVARAAADKAVALRPKDPEAALVLGRVAFSQYAALREDEAQKDAADAAWTAALAAFRSAADLLAASTAPDAAARRIDALQQLGWLAVWKERPDEAAQEFGAAIGIDPTAIDYARLQATLTPEAFVAALEQGLAACHKAYGADTPSDATLQWWLGFGRYLLKRYDEAESAFQVAVAKWPAYVNSWYYIALSRYFRQDYDGAIAALRTHFTTNPDDCAAAVRSNEAENLRILDYLIGVKAAKRANLDAAFLSEVQAAVQPQNDRYWNNLGLFLRDEGEAREQRRKQLTPEEKAEILDLYERSFAAYRRSLELSPNDPNYLNDTALMLHYHLDRDLDQARAWYVRAQAAAQAELDRKDLTSEVRDLRKIALRDATNNLAALDKLLEKRRQAEEERKRKEEEERKKREEGGTPPAPAPGGSGG